MPDITQQVKAVIGEMYVSGMMLAAQLAEATAALAAKDAKIAELEAAAKDKHPTADQ